MKPLVIFIPQLGVLLRKVKYSDTRTDDIRSIREELDAFNLKIIQ